MTFKVELGNKPNATGAFIVYLRITQNRKLKRISLGFTLPASQFNPKGTLDRKNWVRSSHPFATTFNDTISTRIAEAMEARIELKTQATRETIASVLKETDNGTRAKSFLAFAEEYIERFRLREYNTYRGKKSSLNKFKAFLTQSQYKDLLFSQISLPLLKNYTDYLLKLGNNHNTTEKELTRLRSILNEAIREDLFPYEKNPFLKFKFGRKKSEKVRLTQTEIHKLEKLALPEGSLLFHVRNAYIFSFYAAGIRCGDLLQLRWRNIQDGRLVYQMNKTSLPISLKLPSQALSILEYYREGASPESFLFPFFDSKIDYSDSWFLKKEVSAKNALLNKYLKMLSEKAEIGKPLSMHTARHTFADIGRKRTKDVYAISKALGHSSIRITQQYLSSFDTETVDNALEGIYA